ncbi:MAG: hypothetical protein F4X20_03460 [Dehalococcoidia bacterium]|nr:hypothetical protein [Dehalococcoidia bacterium]
MKAFGVRRLIPARAFGLLLLTLALAMVLAVAACESEDDPTATPQPADTSSTTGQTDTSQTGSSGDTQMDHEPLQVIATSNIVGDWIKNIGGDRVEVTSLIPPGGDPHTYQPGARDVANIVDADLVFTVGLQLEGQWLEELIHNASTDESKIIALAEAVNPIEFAETGAHHDEHDDHDDHMDEMGHEDLTGRLLIADGDSATVSVLDLTTEQLDEGSLQVAAPAATLYTSPSGRFAFALARGPGDDAANDDRVHIFDGGIYLEEHGDHFDLVTDSVSRLTVGTTDNRPIHFNPHAGWTAIFHDGSGRIALFEEHDLIEELNEYEPAWLEAGLQHGAGIVLEDGNVLVTTNNPDYPSVSGTSSLPLGAEVWTMGGDVVFDGASRACPALHGEASNAHGTVFGCAGGVLFIHAHFGEYEHSFIENPADMNPAARIGTLWGHHDSEYFFGSASYSEEGGARLNGGLWMIDAEGDEMSLVLPPTAEKTVRSAAFDAHGEHLYVLTYDGLLNVIHVEHGEVEETYELVEAFEGSNSPSFIVVGEFLYLSDRVGGQIIEFHLPHGEIERTWPIGGQPRSIAFVGLGVDDHHEDEHAHEDEHDHDEDDDHEDEDEHDDHDHHDHDHGTHDPHFWFDPIRVQTAVIDIATRLAMMDPAGAETYTANATAYVAQLQELHAWSEQQVATIPADHRILVTSHDTHSYFALLYGFEVVGTVIPSGTTETESSAEQLAELVEIIEHEGVPAVFGENTVPERIARTIADETGAGFYSLFTGSLGPAGSGADTYLTMFRRNIEILVEALG